MLAVMRFSGGDVAEISTVAVWCSRWQVGAGGFVIVPEL
jgi:hypothetical protein